MVYVFLAILIAAAGTYLIGDFIWRRYSGKILSAEVTGFQNVKNKFYKLPVVVYEDDGKIINLKTQKIEQFTYLLNPPIKGMRVKILLNPETGRASVYGFINLMTGLLLFMPAIMLAAMEVGKRLLYAQSIFVLIFFGMILVAGMGVRFIQKSY